METAPQELGCKRIRFMGPELKMDVGLERRELL